jgi:hypothetical protein
MEQRCRILSVRLSIRCTLFGCTLQLIISIRFLRLRYNPFNFAHLSRHVSITFESHDSKLSRMNTLGNLATDVIVIRTWLR